MKTIFFVVLLILSSILFSFEQAPQKFSDTYTRVDWEKMKILGKTRITVPPIAFSKDHPGFLEEHTALNITQARKKALSIARERLQAELYRSIELMVFDEDNRVIDKIKASESFRNLYNRIFTAESGELKVKYSENTVISESSIPILGKDGLMNVLEQNYGKESFPTFPSIPNPPSYTGFILDARHLKAHYSLFPVITTDQGLEIYSPELVQKNAAIDNGYVVYMEDPLIAKNDKRVGSNPYYILADSVQGQYKTSFSIPTMEAMRLLSSRDSRNSLKKCRVIILLKKEDGQK